MSRLPKWHQESRPAEMAGWPNAETLLYRAVIASRFGHGTEGNELLQKVLATNPNPAVARKTRAEMASAFARLGHYKDAAQAWGEALLLTPGNDPEREGNENTRALMAALSEVAPETAKVEEMYLSRPPVTGSVPGTLLCK